MTSPEKSPAGNQRPIPEAHKHIEVNFYKTPDCDGIRHLVRIASIQRVCDADQTQDETVLFVANKALCVPILLDALMPIIDPAGRQKPPK